jgi:hypothetical protein
MITKLQTKFAIPVIRLARRKANKDLKRFILNDSFAKK